MTTNKNVLSRVKVAALDHPRRRFIKNGLADIAYLVLATLVFPPTIKAESAYPKNSIIVVNTLAKALRSIGSPVCLAAALRLEADQRNDNKIHFYLRDAALKLSDALIIAKALKSLPSESHSALLSMSLSFNNAIGDAGAIALAQSIPPTIRELGLVDCGISDAGGEAFLQWAKHATGLRMLCIEQNHISEGLKLQLIELMHRNASLLVIV